jgi:hypothetical protein
MQRAITVPLVLVLAVLSGACEVERITFGDAGATTIRERWQPWLETGRTVYRAWFTAETIELDIGFTFHNRGRTTVAIPRCTLPHQPALDKLVGGEWVEVVSPIHMCWEDPVTVGPGRSRHFTYRLRAGRSHTPHEPRFRTSRIPGTYRLRWEIYHYDALAQFRIGPPLPIEHRVSNEFQITL